MVPAPTLEWITFIELFIKSSSVAQLNESNDCLPIETCVMNEANGEAIVRLYGIVKEINNRWEKYSTLNPIVPYWKKLF